MTLDEWYEHVRHDAEQRDIPELEALVGMLHLATVTLRRADWSVRGASAPHDETTDTP